MELLATSLKTITRTQGQNIITQNELGSQFFIIAKGEVEVVQNGERLRTLGKYDYFGERALLYNEARTATVRCHASDPVELWVMDQPVFIQLIQRGLLDYLELRIALQNTNFELADLIVDRILGEGTFGIVKLVRHYTTNTRYALKCVDRESIVEKQIQEHIRIEREILLENEHPFIIKMVRTFKDRKYLYFLMELVTGGELYEAIRTIGLLSTAMSQFYLGSMILALESLHQRNIIYRDLKPENILLDAQGYLKLIDFGCCKKMAKSRTFTLLGTPHYMAPEVIIGKGYSLSVDLWSLGVCAYEFIYGPLPFANDETNQLKIFRQILAGKLVFPPQCDKDSMDFSKRLLCRTPELRLGSSKHGMLDIMEHPFFEDFDFDQLLGRSLKAPLVPDDEVYQKDAGELSPISVLNNCPSPGYFAEWEKAF